jgi:hypothetical protein
MLGAALPAWTVILAGLVAIAGLFAQSATYLNHDVAWVLYSSERLLVGGVFGKEIVAANPPLIWWISAVPAFLAKMFGLDPVTTFRLFAVAIAAASLIASERLMRRSVAMLPRGLFVLTGAFLFVAGTGRDFGQREVLAVMLALPYLTAAAGRVHGNVPALAPALLIGAAAGLGIALKPYFIAVPLLIEIILAVRLRTWRIAFRPEACAAHRIAHLLEVRGIRQDLDGLIFIDNDVLCTGIDGGFHDGVLVTVGPVGKLTDMIEQVADGPVRTEVAAEFRERMADFRHRPIAIVGHAVDHHRGAARSVALVTNLLVVGAVKLPRATLDRPVDIVFGHALGLGLVDGQPQARVGGNIATANASGNCDLANQFREQLAALLVLGALAVLDIRPLAVSCHACRNPGAESCVDRLPVPPPAVPPPEWSRSWSAPC